MIISEPEMLRILLLDSEWTPNVGVFWRLGKQFVSYEQITQERSIISTQYMWLEDNVPSLISISQNKAKFHRDPFDDETVIRKTHKLLCQTDVVVCHNSRFDLRMFNGRAFFYDLPPLPPIKVICTLKESRKLRELNCHKLDYIMKFKGSSGKIKMEWEDWIQIAIYRNYEALLKMDKYGLRDVVHLKKMYLDLRPHILNHPNWNLVSEKPCCPKCGSTLMKKNGTRMMATRRYQQYTCRECGGYAQSTISVGGATMK